MGIDRSSGERIRAFLLDSVGDGTAEAFPTNVSTTSIKSTRQRSLFRVGSHPSGDESSQGTIVHLHIVNSKWFTEQACRLHELIHAPEAVDNAASIWVQGTTITKYRHCLQNGQLTTATNQTRTERNSARMRKLTHTRQLLSAVPTCGASGILPSNPHQKQ